MRKKSKLTYGVIGLGRFGMALAVTLAESDNDVIVMDREELHTGNAKLYRLCLCDK